MNADQNQPVLEVAPEADPQMQEIFDYVVDLFENNSDFSSLEPEHSSPFYLNSINRKLYFASKFDVFQWTNQEVIQTQKMRDKFNPLPFR